MKNRQIETNKIYIPYVEKHLGTSLLQNILVTGGEWSSYACETRRHSAFRYENMVSYELIDKRSEHQQVIMDNILNPIHPYPSVNLIFADIGGGHECNTHIWDSDIIEGVQKILENGFIDNRLGKIVFMYFDGMLNIPCFLDKQYGEYISEDFFSTEVQWYDEYHDSVYSQRLDGVVFSTKYSKYV